MYEEKTSNQTMQAEPEHLNSVQEDLEIVFSVMNDMHSIIDLLRGQASTSGSAPSPSLATPSTVAGLASALTISTGNLRERLQSVRNRIGVLD